MEDFDKLCQIQTQFIVFSPLGCCSKETIDFDKWVSFARFPESPLIQPGDVTQ